MRPIPCITGMFQGDLIIKTCIELAFEDIKKQPWLIEDIFGSLIENPYLRAKYGMKEIERAKEYLLNNDIPIYMRHRIDKQEIPCITISIGQSTEDRSLATLGDQSHIVEQYSADEIGTPIKFIIPPFNPISYDSDTGIVEVPTEVDGYQYIGQGMVAVDPDTGNGYVIQSKAGTNGFLISTGASITGKLAIIPRFQVYRARRERAISQESYNIGCHAHGDPSTLLFLYNVVKYGLYRYRESLLESSNFQISNLSSTDMVKNDAFGQENVYSRFLTLSGQVEESWVKAPHRVIEAVDIADPNADSTALFPQGIKILSNTEPPNQDPCDIYAVVKDEKLDE